MGRRMAWMAYVLMGMGCFLGGIGERLEVQADPGGVILGKDQSEMVLIPEGLFHMGSEEGGEDEEPVHEVHLKGFYLDVYEVTTALYGHFMDATQHVEPHGWEVNPFLNPGLLLDIHRGSNRVVPNKPVLGVSWYDAHAYCAYYGKRLPTEAEWEKAARGTDQRRHPWGNDRLSAEDWPPVLLESGWGVHYGHVVDVGSHEEGVSPYGVHDLAGNVWEWVSDWYGPAYYGVSVLHDPQGPASGVSKVLRGGSWSDPPEHIRSAYRTQNYPTMHRLTYGFRCAMNAHGLEKE